MKLCTKCHQRPRQSQFSANPWCTQCNSVASKVRYTPEQGHVRNLRDHYKGFSHKQYEELFAAQGGICAICGRPEMVINYRTKQVQNLHVDHCHRIGKVRGLLCLKCNTAYAELIDDPERIRILLAYAEKPVMSD